MKALLIQARDPDDPMKAHEFQCFARRSGLSAGELVSANAVENDPFPVDAVDVVLIGGSGQYSATREFPWMEPVLDAIREASGRRKPVFGSCWGFHMIARAFGSPVVTNDQKKELGTLPVTLTNEGKADEVFSFLPTTFFAQLGHRDHVPQIPSGAVCLAYNQTHTNQAFRIQDAPTYATQFHPELTAEDMRIRVKHYIDLGYVSEEEKAYLQDILRKFHDTPECSLILGNFIRRFCP